MTTVLKSFFNLIFIIKRLKLWSLDDEILWPEEQGCARDRTEWSEVRALFCQSLPREFGKLSSSGKNGGFCFSDFWFLPPPKTRISHLLLLGCFQRYAYLCVIKISISRRNNQNVSVRDETTLKITVLCPTLLKKRTVWRITIFNRLKLKDFDQ